MSDTISRAKAIEAIEELRNEYDPNATWCGDCRISHPDKDAKDVLEALPPAQPERIKGHWVNGRCDKCNEHAPFWAMASTYYASNFCPNCGADMREVTT